ncbi:MAG TPA: glycosyltransferase family 39 protein [Oscillatoriaceae cyanobacterium]
MSLNEQAQSRSADRRVLVILAIALVTLLLPFLLTSVFHPDEFTDLYEGVWILHGAAQYRDIHDGIAPISPYLAACTFALLGPSLLAGRFVQTGVIFLCGLQIFRLAQRLEVPAWMATIPSLALVVGVYRAWPGYSHHWLAIPWMLAAVLTGFGALDGGRSRTWFFAGLATGGAMLAMQTDGVVITGVLAGVLLAHGLLTRETFTSIARQFGMLAFGIAVPISLAALFIGSQGALPQAVNQIWIAPLFHAKVAGGYNDVKYGSDWLAQISPIAKNPTWLGRAFHLSMTYLLSPVAIIGGLLVLLPKTTRLSPADWRLALAGLMAAGYFTLLSVEHADYPMVAVYAVPALPVLSALAMRWARRFQGHWHAWLGHCLLGAYTVTGVLLLTRFMAASPQNWMRLSSPDARIRSVPVLQYLREHTRPGDRLIAMPNGGIFYFYGRPAATRFPLIWPLWTRFNTPEQLAEVRSEIARNQPKFVVLGPYIIHNDDITAYLNGPLPSSYHEIPRVFHLHGGPVYLFERESP